VYESLASPVFTNLSTTDPGRLSHCWPSPHSVYWSRFAVSI